jgi:hypothetical protein
MSPAQQEKYLPGETLMTPRLDAAAGRVAFMTAKVVAGAGRAPETDLIRMRFDDQFEGEVDVRRVFRTGPAFDAWRAAGQEIAARGKSADRTSRLDAAWRALCATNPYCGRKR